MFDDLGKPNDKNKGDNNGDNNQINSPSRVYPQGKERLSNNGLTGANPQDADSTPLAETSKEPEDIFSETEKPPADNDFSHSPETTQFKPDVLAPKKETAGEAEAPEKPGSGSRTRKLIIPLSLVLSITVLGAGGFWGYRYVMQLIGPANVKTNEAINDNEAAENGNEAENEEVINNKVPDIPPDLPPEEEAIEPLTIPGPAESGTDRDKDGLYDSEEISLGTDINNVDTDGDGLFDREEVRVYQTNPLIEDTDGDGFLDGVEVEGGYNPNGPGRLYEIK